MEKKELTRAELQLMNLLWEKGAAFVNELLTEFPDPKPAYTTVSTFMRILETKGFVGHKSFGKSHQYYPLITREEYMDSFMGQVKKTFFKGSFSSMISFFARKEKLSSEEIGDIIELLNENKQPTASE